MDALNAPDFWAWLDCRPMPRFALANGLAAVGAYAIVGYSKLHLPFSHPHQYKCLSLQAFSVITSNWAREIPESDRAGHSGMSFGYSASMQTVGMAAGV